MDFDLRSHAPFHLTEVPLGRQVEFHKICDRAEVRRSVTTKRLPQVRLHGGGRDLLVPLPGRNIYCLSRLLLPKVPRDAAFAALERLAYGAHDWAAMETLRAHRRRQRDEACVRDDVGDARRAAFKEALPLRRLIRSRPDVTDQEAATILGLSLADTVRLRTLQHVLA